MTLGDNEEELGRKNTRASSEEVSGKEGGVPDLFGHPAAPAADPAGAAFEGQALCQQWQVDNLYQQPVQM
jgi:hypothetical protein